jgi:hypothetical protein
MYKDRVRCLLLSTLAGIALCGIERVQAQTTDLEFGKRRASAAFPCTPELHKGLAARLGSGSEVFRRDLLCTQGDRTCTVSVTEYPTELMNACTVDELLESYRENVLPRST